MLGLKIHNVTARPVVTAFMLNSVKSIHSRILQVLNGHVLRSHLAEEAADVNKKFTSDTIRQADMVLQASCRWKFVRKDCTLVCLGVLLEP